MTPTILAIGATAAILIAIVGTFGLSFVDWMLDR